MEKERFAPEGDPHKLVKNLISKPVKSKSKKNAEKFHPASLSDSSVQGKHHGGYPRHVKTRP